MKYFTRKKQLTSRQKTIGKKTIILTYLTCLTLINNTLAVSKFDFPRFNRLTSSQGLSSNNTTCLAQDSIGFIWIGSKDGLNRFNGHEFDIFRNSTGDSTSITNNQINALLVDKKGRLWIATDYGLNGYNYETNSFSRHIPLMNSPRTIPKITSLAQGNDDEIWVGSTGGLFLFVPGKGFSKEFYASHHTSLSLLDNSIHALWYDSPDSLWIGYATRGLSLFNPGKNHFEHFSHQQGASGGLSDNSIMDIHRFDGKIWIATAGGGINTISIDTRTIEHISLEETNYVKKFTAGLTSKELWICSIHGLYNYNRDTKTITTIPYQENDPFRRGGTGVDDLMVDKQGILWVASLGLSFSYPNRVFETYTPGTPEGRLSNTMVKTITRTSKGTYWIGYWNNGIDVLDHNMNKIEYWSLIDNGSIFKIMEDSKGTIWIASYKGGLQRYYPRSGKIESVLNNFYVEGLGYTNDIRDIDEDQEGNLWLAVHGVGIARYNPATGALKTYQRDDGSNWCYSLKIDHKNKLWFGSVNGVSVLDPINGQYLDYFAPDGDEIPRIFNMINCIFEDSSNIMWIGTNAGLLQFGANEGEFKYYSTIDGLPSNYVVSIAESPKGTLWLGTIDGLCMMSIQGKIIQSFGSKDGLYSSEMLPGAIFVDKTGSIYMGSRDGLTVLAPDKIRENMFVPPVVITSLSLFNNPILHNHDIYKNHAKRKSTHSSPGIVLKYSQNVITFDYVALNLVKPQKNQYAYMMDGFDKDWQFAGTRRNVTYTNLNPGKYIFRVIAANNDGLWNKEGASIQVTILPPFYRTGWFRILLLLFASLLLVGYISWRTQSLKKRSMILEYKILERTRSIEYQKELLIEQRDIISEQLSDLADQKIKLEATNQELKSQSKSRERLFAILSHDIKNPFQGIMGFSRLLATNYTKYDDEKRLIYAFKILESSEKLYALLENLLHWVKTNIENRDPKIESINLKHEIESAIEVLKAVASEQDVNFHVNIYPTWNVMANQTMLNIVLRNLVHNAIKYSPKGSMVHLSATRDEAFTKVEISDKGQGISFGIMRDIKNMDIKKGFIESGKVKGTGMGLFLCIDFIEKMKGAFTIKHTSKHGTTVVVKLPNSNEVISLAPPPVLPSGENTLEIKPELVKHLAGKTILVVDDDPNMLKLFSEIFPGSAKIILAANGSEAFTKAETILPDIIISDVIMPGISGLGLLCKLKKSKNTSHIPVILMSGNDTDDLQIKCLQEKADDFLSKPFNRGIFLLKVSNILERQENKRLLFNKNGILQLDNMDLTSIDEELVKKTIQYIHENIEDAELNVETLSKVMGYSRAQFYRKLKCLFNLSPLDFIRSVRLNHAANLIISGKFRVNEVAMHCGFNEYRYFSKCFKEYFEMSPTDYYNKYRLDDKKI